MMRHRPDDGGYCERCDKPKKTLPLHRYQEIENVCKDCIYDSDFSRHEDHQKQYISQDEINQIVLDIGAAMHKRGLHVWYNEDFNVIRYGVAKHFLKDWNSYEGNFDSYCKWWELKASHPYWKDISEPKRNW